MSLPFNSYDQMRYRGNEYVTDQTLNRTVYRLFQNDVYLDNSIQDHINNDSVHYTDSDDSIVDYLTSDKKVVLAAHYTGSAYTSGVDIIADESLGTYSEKSWQRLIDEQPKNLGGNSLTFRFQKASNSENNPTVETNVENADVINFSDFYGGTLIIESPTAYVSNTIYQDSNNSPRNQRLVISSKGNANCIFNIENCHCKVLVRNCRLRLLPISSYTNITENGDSDWSAKDSGEGIFSPANKMNGVVFRNDKKTTTDDGWDELKRYSASSGKWVDLNMISAIRIDKSPDVEIHHCYIEYYKG